VGSVGQSFGHVSGQLRSRIPTRQMIPRGPLLESVVRRFVPLLASMALLGCEASVSGTYELVSFDGQELPYTFEFWGDSLVLTSSSLTLRDSTFEWATTVLDGDGEGELSTESGTFTLDESNTICFTTLASGPTPPPPPPPPSPVDANSSVPPAPAERASRPPSGSRTECIGRWEGDEITISDAEATGVFRR